MGDQKISVDYQKLDGRRSQWDTKFSGVRNILYERYTETTNENTKARLEKYIREEPCSSCHGARLRPEMLAVTVGGKSIYEVCCLSCRESLEFFEGLELTERQQFIGGRIVKEILERLRFLVDVGLDYLTLDPCLGDAFPEARPSAFAWQRRSRPAHGCAVHFGRAVDRPPSAR